VADQRRCKRANGGFDSPTRAKRVETDEARCWRVNAWDQKVTLLPASGLHTDERDSKNQRPI
jgi:hypothetical protein